MTPVPMPCRALTSVIDGSSSPEARTPDRMASVSVSATCCQAGRESRGLIASTGTLRCSMNGLPVQARSPQRLSSAYSLSSMGPRTFRTFIGPRAGLMVRRMNPSLVCRVDTSHGAIAAYSSSSLATVASDSGVRPSDASLSSLPSSMWACCSVLAVALRRISRLVIGSIPAYTRDAERPARQLLYVTFGDPWHGIRIGRISDIRSTNRSTDRDRMRANTLLNWEPVSGFEPLTCRLQDGCSAC